ncbi:phospholipase A2 inhibitor and Ly6/PLAUR domain-containing protein-like [Hyla sarda]|uniref:phospholipase A2 inhibitor and Ly6/PLAUR domain-containing protein-like n=1 Tax=Hyla sarda TaxID=327740 RepID=UPI0024C20D29|nr:phospholipase A2 inhibitor and Ly6/PLAUR domain-containing protein-like [Hyla sarda]
MYLWGFLFFLTAFAATGECLECVTCRAVSPDPCSVNTSGNCSDGQVCASQFTSSITSQVISLNFRRSCAPQSECGVLGTFTYGTTSERVSTTCCSTDLCNPETPKLPFQNSVPNGLVCSACSLPVGSCSADQYMNCSGDMTMCLVMTKQQITGVQSLLTISRGCASSNYCLRSNLNYTEDGVYTEFSYICTNATNFTMYNIISTTAASLTQTTNTGTSLCSFLLSSFISIFLFLMLM